MLTRRGLLRLIPRFTIAASMSGMVLKASGSGNTRILDQQTFFGDTITTDNLHEARVGAHDDNVYRQSGRGTWPVVCRR